MAENSEHHQEPLFRPNKRRKVFRKRTVEDDEGTEERQSGNAELDGATVDVNALHEDSSERLPVVRRPVAKKHGIGFSSGGATNQGPSRQDEATETALVPVVDKEAGSVMHSDRFTKPTGNVGVVEDKHLTAYVDSKLAELRSSSATPLGSRNSPAAPAEGLDDNSSSQAASATGLETTTTAEGSSTKDEIDAPRKGYPYGSRGRNKKPRRQPHVRDASDIARDAMVDAIMREGQVPLYDQSNAGTASNVDSSDVDKDEAAAEAFKAQFLADLEQRKRRKPPAQPTAGQASSGPKLGGSRSQREKMRALEEAKNATGKK